MKIYWNVSTDLPTKKVQNKLQKKWFLVSSDFPTKNFKIKFCCIKNDFNCYVICQEISVERQKKWKNNFIIVIGFHLNAFWIKINKYKYNWI